MFKLLSAFSIRALPSSGHRGIGSVARRCLELLPAAFPGSTAGPSHGQGSWGGALLCFSEEMRLEQGQCLAVGACRVSSASPHPSLGSPSQGHGTTTVFRGWQKTLGVGSLSLRQLPAALWAILPLHFQPSHHKKLCTGEYCTAPSKTTPDY